MHSGEGGNSTKKDAHEVFLHIFYCLRHLVYMLWASAALKNRYCTAGKINNFETYEIKLKRMIVE